MCGGSSAARTWASSAAILLLTDRWLLAVSNRTITAYPRRAPGTEVTARDDSASPKGADSP